MSEMSEVLVPWFQQHRRELPWREEGFGAWGILVSEFMLQQTQVSRVIPLLDAWLARWPTPADLAAAAPSEAVTAWANLGYPRRALWLHRAATEITQRHGNVVPADVEALLALTGIGDYTARAVVTFAYGVRAPVVDTNTRRVIARAVHGKSQPAPPHRQDLADMDALLPPDDADAALFNAAAMELGAIVCTSRAPKCDECPIAHICAWRQAGYPDTGDTRRKQSAFEGSDRQARGAALRAVRTSDPLPVPTEALLVDWHDPEQRERALATLLADGLLVHSAEGYSLPR